jgi:hypothetical protein
MAIMWTLTAITWVFVALRTYTRVIVVRQFGADDWVYLFSGVSSLFPPLEQGNRQGTNP